MSFLQNTFSKLINLVVEYAFSIAFFKELPKQHIEITLPEFVKNLLFYKNLNKNNFIIKI